ncbi:hypothetical protein VPHD479_0174 [Vibrio phage D479]
MKTVYVDITDIMTNDAVGYAQFVGAPKELIPEDKREAIHNKLVENNFFAILPGTFIVDYIARFPSVAKYTKFILSPDERVAEQQIEWVSRVMLNADKQPIDIEVVTLKDVPHEPNVLMISASYPDLIRHGGMGGEILHFKGLSQLEFVLGCISKARDVPLSIVK